jgi:hypothetical protein
VRVPPAAVMREAGCITQATKEACHVLIADALTSTSRQKFQILGTELYNIYVYRAAFEVITAATGSGRSPQASEGECPFEGRIQFSHISWLQIPEAAY